MKSIYLPLSVAVLSLSATALNAQISLNSNEFLGFGNTYVLKTISDLTMVDTTIQGANVTWNFSGLTVNSSGTDMNVTVMDPAATPNGSVFPTANYCLKESPTIAYRYFNKTAAKMERVGSYTSAVNAYNDPQVEYVFPMTYGTVNSDTWDNTQSSSGGTYDLNCIGTGSLQLPNGTHNAIMTRIHVVESFVEIDAYYWYDADNGSILLYLVGPSFFSGASGKFQTNLYVGIDEFDAVSDLQYVNPVNDRFTASFTNRTGAELTYTIVDMNGRQLEAGTPSMEGSNGTINTDVSGLKAGMYMIRIVSADGQEFKSVKFIKN